MKNRRPDLSVITVNYNGYHDTCEFIHSWVGIVMSVSYEIIVVDNGSSHDEAALLQEKYPYIRTLRSEQNLGFAGGNNLGINMAQGKFLFLLNNDTIIVQDTIHLLISRLQESSRIAGVSPLIRDYSFPHAIQFAGYTPLSSITLRNKAIGKGKVGIPPYRAQRTPYLHGAAMLIKKEIIIQVGNMCEDYFLYYEELDWCTRITQKGYELWYDSACEVWHKDSSSVGKNSPLQCYYLSRNRLLYADRHLNGWRHYLAILYQLLIVYPKNILTALAKGEREKAQSYKEGTKAFFKLNNKVQQL